jgi:DNA-binding MarR family transcriptional regulator
MGNKALVGHPTDRIREPDHEDVSLEEIRELGQLIPAFHHALKSIGPPDLHLVAALDGGVKLTSRHLTALHNLVLEGPQSVSELAVRLHVALPTASLLVGDLGRAGLVERSEDQADRRRTIVRISATHASAVDEFLKRRVEPVRRVLAQLEPRDRATFVRCLHLLVDEFTAIAAEMTHTEDAPAPASGAR